MQRKADETASVNVRGAILEIRFAGRLVISVVQPIGEKMKLRGLLAVGLFVFPILAVRAQESPRVEVFGGYSYGNYGPTVSGEGRQNYHGWNGSVAINVNHWVGFVSDFSGHYGSFKASNPVPPIVCVPGSSCVITTTGDDKYHNFLFGPQFSLRRDKVTLFVRAMTGASHLNESSTTVFPPTIFQPGNTFRFSRSATNFVFAEGGGVDYKVSERVAWRVQADYFHVSVPVRGQNDVRVSTGPVFHF